MRRMYNKAYIRKLFVHLMNRPLRIKAGHLYVFMASGKKSDSAYAIWTRGGLIHFGQFNDKYTITEIARTEFSGITVGCSTRNFYGTDWYGNDYYSVRCFEDISINDFDIDEIWYYSGLAKPKYLGNYCVERGSDFIAPIDYMN